jgi:acetyl-CoA C-acetyltransferase
LKSRGDSLTGNVFIISATRTRIGRFGGVLKDLNAPQLTTIVLNELIIRGRIKKGDLDEIIWGGMASANKPM